MNKWHPYPDRKEHDYVNEMTVVIARARLIITEATKVIDNLQEVVERHIKVSKEVRKNDKSRKD